CHRRNPGCDGAAGDTPAKAGNRGIDTLLSSPRKRGPIITDREYGSPLSRGRQTRYYAHARRSPTDMTATALDSTIFRDIFSTAEMRQVFSDENRTVCYLAIEAALARVQGRLGIIPAEAAREIDSKCKVENIDFAKLKATTERIGYPILGVVQQ